MRLWEVCFVILLLVQMVISSWLTRGKVMAWQQNPQLYLLGAAPKCTQAKVELSPFQNAMCTSGGYQDHMSSVNVGLLLALNECYHQFTSSQWNCSDVELEKILEGLKDSPGSKEDAFIHAATAAGIAHAVSRGCRNGLISACSCSLKERPDSLDRDWVWGGCGDNIDYGYDFAQAFVDLREKERNHPKGSKELAMMLVNKHNNEAGRRTVQRGDVVECKCHGVSGSCSLKTCWQELSPFRRVGDKMKENYEVAMQVAFNKDGTRLRNTEGRRAKRRAKKEELVYLNKSPNLCVVKEGQVVMAGRRCNATSTGEDNCDTMCCGRGFEPQTITIQERCNCQFEWCCYVQCDMCTRKENIFVCK